MLRDIFAGEINTTFHNARIKSRPDEWLSQHYCHDVPALIKTTPWGEAL